MFMSALVTLTVTSRLPPAGCSGSKRRRASKSLKTPGTGLRSKVAVNSSLLPAGSMRHSGAPAACVAPASSRPTIPSKVILILMASTSRQHPDQHLVALHEMMPQGRSDVHHQHRDEQQRER